MKTIIKYTIKGIDIRLVCLNDIPQGRVIRPTKYIIVICKPHKSTEHHLWECTDKVNAIPSHWNRKSCGLLLPNKLTYDVATKKFFRLCKQAQLPQISFE